MWSLRAIFYRGSHRGPEIIFWSDGTVTIDHCSMHRFRQLCQGKGITSVSVVGGTKDNTIER